MYGAGLINFRVAGFSVLLIPFKRLYATTSQGFEEEFICSVLTAIDQKNSYLLELIALTFCFTHA